MVAPPLGRRPKQEERDVNAPERIFRADRHPADSYEDILDRDLIAPPDFLRQRGTPDIGTAPVLASRYFDPAFFEKERAYLWPRVWQMACREEEIPQINDYFIYENVGKSFIVVRTAPDEFKAFYNSCLHRGRKLVTLNGCKSEFRCPYHGIAWNTDGTFKDNPIGWDFPQWQDRDVDLPQAKVDRWGGFIFINMDLGAPPLAQIMEPLIDDYANRYKAVHVCKKVRCNWKATAEAFMESHHSVTTHPQILPGIGDCNSQYDILNDYVSRQFSASAVQSPLLEGHLSEQQIADYMMGRGDTRRPLAAASGALPEGMNARSFVAAQVRAAALRDGGNDFSAASDAEMIDSLLYNVFPHMSFWAGYASNLTYRWRPNGLDPDSALMDVMIMRPVPKNAPRPKPAPVHELGLDDPWSDAPEMGEGLITIFSQDMGNLPYVQEGLRASGTGVVHFGRYTETRIRHHHQMIDRYIAEGEAKGA
jgi:nitrite reductase/ring-hydroxylating ferredoxin subunit